MVEEKGAFLFFKKIKKKPRKQLGWKSMAAPSSAAFGSTYKK